MKAGSVSKIGVLVSSLAALALTSVTAQAVETITAWDLQTTTGAVKILGDAAARFEKANPGFKVEQSHIERAYKTKLKIAFGANQPPCVFSAGAAFRLWYVKAGQVVDLTPYLDKDPAFKDRFARLASAR